MCVVQLMDAIFSRLLYYNLPHYMCNRIFYYYSTEMNIQHNSMAGTGAATFDQ